MIKENLVSEDKNLFTTFETDYFNFIFNNQSFNDNLAIRNKYLHTGHIDIDEKEVNTTLIKLLFEIIMKIHFSINYK